MKFRLCDWNAEEIWCFDQLAPMLHMSRDSSGMPLRLQKADAPGCGIQDGNAVIFYTFRYQIWRQLGILCEHGETPFHLIEKPAYRDLGVMLDCSRNGVLTPEAVMDLTRHLVLMGYASIQLYTEDTYQIDGEPYFGYQRGAYTAQELRSIDNYTAAFGVELVPCIQTLAHLDCVLHWKNYEKVRDFGNILLSGQEETYELIRKMFRQMSQCLRSRRINIGMDEAHMLGRGQYLDLHGYENPTEIMLDHYKKVLEIARSFGYTPMMWSDMFFRLASHGEYYGKQPVDAVISKNMDENVTLVYWDYYSLDSSQYDRMIRSHREITENIAFAGGAWKWEGPCPNSYYSVAAARAAHASCLRNGISQVLITAWGDNGDECPLYAVLPAFQQWAELCYENRDEDDYMERRFHTCVGGSYHDFLHLGDAVLMPDNPAPGRCGVNPVRYLLYQDLLGGLFDSHTEESQREHLKVCAETMETCRNRAPDRWKYLFETQYILDRLLSEKCMLGNEIRSAYSIEDRNALLKCSEKAQALLPLLEQLLEATEEQWCRENKIFGLDVLILQMGGLRERIKFAADRLRAYAESRISVLEELEEPALPYYGEDQRTVQSPCWNRIVSASNH